MDWYQLSEHGYKRLKERHGVKGGQASNRVKQALTKGKAISDCPSYMQNYLRNVLAASQGNNIKVWGNDVYLFINEILITTFPIPRNIARKASRQKFYTINDDEYEDDEY